MKKLVRDKIPEIIRKRGEVPLFYVAMESEYKRCLHEKLIEESNELNSASKVEDIKTEIADVLEVLDAIMKTHGIVQTEIMDIKAHKRNERGGFDRHYILDMGEK